MKTISILLYQQKVNDTKHNVIFLKDKVSYGGHTFDGIIAKVLRPRIEEAIKGGLKYPLSLVVEAGDEHYFPKKKKYTRNDGTSGEKWQIVIKDVIEIKQGKFENKTLDEIISDMDKKETLDVEDIEEA